MLIVSYLSSRQFTGYCVSAKLVLSSVFEIPRMLAQKLALAIRRTRRNPLHFLPRAPSIELYTDRYSPLGGLQVVEIIFAMKGANVENHCCFVSFSVESCARCVVFVLLRYRTAGLDTVVI